MEFSINYLIFIAGVFVGGLIMSLAGTSKISDNEMKYLNEIDKLTDKNFQQAIIIGNLENDIRNWKIKVNELRGKLGKYETKEPENNL